MNILSSIELIVPAVSTLGAAFLGAWCAFKLQDRDHERKMRANAMAGGNRAIFTLMRQWNSLKLVQQQIIEPYRTDPNRFVLMRPILNLDYKDLKLDMDSLSFILETSHRQCLADLFLAERKFQTAMMVIDERSRLHLQTVQPLLERAGLIEGSSYIKEEIENALGIRLSSSLSRVTDDAIEGVDQAIVSLKEVSDKLHIALTQLYPKKKFINFEPLS